MKMYFQKNIFFRFCVSHLCLIKAELMITVFDQISSFASHNFMLIKKIFYSRLQWKQHLCHFEVPSYSLSDIFFVQKPCLIYYANFSSCNCKAKVKSSCFLGFFSGGILFKMKCLRFQDGLSIFLNYIPYPFENVFVGTP